MKLLADNGKLVINNGKAYIAPEVETLQDITITENGTYTPDEGYDGFGEVRVNVSGGGGGMIGHKVTIPAQSIDGGYYLGSGKIRFLKSDGTLEFLTLTRNIPLTVIEDVVALDFYCVNNTDWGGVMFIDANNTGSSTFSKSIINSYAGMQFEDGYPYQYLLFDDITIYKISVQECLTGDTLVTMADGSTKRIDEIALGEEILSYDWDTMTLVPNKVIYTDKDEDKHHTEYDVWTFDDGTIIKTVHRHEFFCCEVGRMQYMDEWQIGQHGYRLDGSKPMIIDHKTVVEDVRHYKITGEKGTNFFANALLNGDRNCPKDIKL